MVVLTEGQHAGEFIVSEANGWRSRDRVTVLSGQNLKAGAVIGVVALGAATGAAVAGNTGNGTMGAVTVGTGAKAGVYKVTFLEPAANLGAFMVEDPDGVNIGNGDVGAAFSGGGIGFTISDGGTDFAAGDQFTITVAAGSLKVKEWNPSDAVGAAVVTGVLLDAVDASAADRPGVIIARDAEVRSADLQWFTGADNTHKATGRAGLKALGIIAR